MAGSKAEIVKTDQGWRLSVPCGNVTAYDPQHGVEVTNTIIWAGTFKSQLEAGTFLSTSVTQVMEMYTLPHSRAAVIDAVYKGHNIDNKGW